MSEREPAAPQPEGAPSGAERWYRRMQDQTPFAVGPGTGVGTAHPRPGKPLAAERRRPAHAASHPAPPARRRRSSIAWLLLLAVLVAAAAVTAVVLDGRVDSGSPMAEADEPAATETPEEAGPGRSPLPGGGETADGDLALETPMTEPTCDGSWVVFVGAATNPASYQDMVTRLLESHPSSKYTVTAGGCASMRQSLPDGTLIYAVYVGPYPDQAAACADAARIGGGAYVKRMDDVTPPEQTWDC